MHLRTIQLWTIPLWIIGLWKIGLWIINLWTIGLWTIGLWKPGPASAIGRASALKSSDPRSTQLEVKNYMY